MLDNGKEKRHVHKGECVFIPRDYKITMYKKSHNGERYCGIFLMFTRNFLRDMYNKLGYKEFGDIEDEQGCPHIWMGKLV